MSSTQTKIVKKVKLVLVETLESCTIDSTRVNGLESEQSRLARIKRWQKQRADVAVGCWACGVGRCFRSEQQHRRRNGVGLTFQDRRIPAHLC